MSEPKDIRLAALALPIACCAGLPLLLTARVGAAAFAVIAGITVAVIAVAAPVTRPAARARRRSAAATSRSAIYPGGSDASA